ncbi:MAG: DNA alkylation repair protein [Candidatus Bathyarchaeia archaeon]|jgi:3-methyladenine DNA glycosylase AlkD
MSRRIVNAYHLELISEVKAHANQLSQSHKERLERYIGTDKTCYVIGADTQRAIIKEWIRKHPSLTEAEYIELLNSLCQGKSVNEISIAGELLDSLPKLRKTVEPRYLDVWLNNAHGWAEVDSLCQSKFPASEVLANWKEWEGLLTKLASNDNVNKKRASLVLLTKPVRDSEDTRLENLAFMNINKLKNHRDILITKAISWLLRDLIKHNRQRVESYLKENEDTLPKIVSRETKTKLLTGRKTPRRTKRG